MSALQITILLVALAVLAASVVFIQHFLRYNQNDSLAGYVVGPVFFLGLCVLGAIASVLGQVGEWWAVAPVVLINIAVQPLFAWLLASSVYKLVLAIGGRPTYAGRKIPKEECAPHEYLILRYVCLLKGVIGCVFYAGLAIMFLWPLLWTTGLIR